MNFNIAFFHLIYYSSIDNTDCIYSYFPKNTLQDKYYRQASRKVAGSHSLKIEFNDIKDCLKTCEYYNGKCEGVNADTVTKVCFIVHSITGVEVASPSWTAFSRHQVENNLSRFAKNY